MSFRIEPAAARDLLAIDAWVIEQFGAQVAENVRRNLFETFARLGEHPRIGRLRPELARPPVRFFSHTPNWIAYLPGNPVLILRILPARTDLTQLEL